VFQVSQSITQGGPAAITILVLIGFAAWAALQSGTLRFGREVDYRDRIIEQQQKTIEDQRATIAAQATAQQQQAEASKQALDMIRQDLLPRLARASSA